MTRKELIKYVNKNHYCIHNCYKCPWDDIPTEKIISWIKCSICAKRLIFYIEKFFGRENALEMYNYILSIGCCLPESYDKNFIKKFNAMANCKKLELE